MNYSHTIRSRTVVTPDGVRPASIVIEDGRIAAIGSYDSAAAGAEDFGNLVVLPGLVDTHVHINEPGRTEWEGFETATKAAAAGGITTLVDMPLNSSPVTTTVQAFRAKLEAAKGKLFVDCGFYAGLIPGNAEHLQSLIDAGVLGVKAFLINSGIEEFPNVGEHELHEAMPLLARNAVPLLAHCELTPGGHTQGVLQDRRSYSDYLASRPGEWEKRAIELVIDCCRKYKCPTHIVHLSDADALQMIREARRHLPLTVETCPHYLVFSAEEINDGDTRFKCAPPIRGKENQNRLWEGLRRNEIDFIVSDHSPSPPQLKCLESGDFQNAWGGIASLQFGLPAIWTAARTRGFSLPDVARWMAYNPAKLVGLDQRKGSIAPGFDADFVIFDPDASFTVTPSMIIHRHKVTPYEGSTLTGVVHSTFLRGKKIASNNSVPSTPAGAIILRS